MKVLCIDGLESWGESEFVKTGQTYESPDWGNGKPYCTVDGSGGWDQTRFTPVGEPMDPTADKLNKIIELLEDLVDNGDDLNEMVMERLSKVEKKEQTDAADAMAYWAASIPFPARFPGPEDYLQPPATMAMRAETKVLIARLNEVVMGWYNGYPKISSPLISRLKDLGFTTSAVRT